MKEIDNMLKEYNQEHLLKYLNNSSDEQRKVLINEINGIDFRNLKRLFHTSKMNNEEKLLGEKIEHISYVDKYKLSKDEFARLEKIGNDIIKNNQYAVVTMAGGQGTRLGHSGPKGTFLLNVKPEPKYLFQIIAEGLEKNNTKYGITLNWYIMTSTENHDKTVEFFKEHNFFGYPKEYIRFFNQGNLPLLSEDGKLLVDENYNIKIAADGNGCIYKAMAEDGIIDDMKDKNI